MAAAAVARRRGTGWRLSGAGRGGSGGRGMGRRGDRQSWRDLCGGGSLARGLPAGGSSNRSRCRRRRSSIWRFGGVCGVGSGVRVGMAYGPKSWRRGQGRAQGQARPVGLLREEPVPLGWAPGRRQVPVLARGTAGVGGLQRHAAGPVGAGHRGRVCGHRGHRAAHMRGRNGGGGGRGGREGPSQRFGRAPYHYHHHNQLTGARVSHPQLPQRRHASLL